MSTMNRLANVSNRFQTPAKRVLAVCSAGLLRSPTVANVLHAEYGYNTRACGATKEYALVPLDEVLIEWADEIVFVEQDVREIAEWEFEELLADKQKVVLDLPDKFEWNHPELRQLIHKQYMYVTTREQPAS